MLQHALKHHYNLKMYKLKNNVVEGDNEICLVMTLQQRRDRRVLGILLNICSAFLFELVYCHLHE